MVDINNLYTKCAYCTTGTNLPIVLLMHGWTGDADSFAAATIQRFAHYGFFVVVPGMRGRNGADGSRDASAREIYDIYDALQWARTNYAAYVSEDKAAIVGYSGGGGNALAAACKFPDTWNCVVSFFGMSDYGRDAVDGWWANNGGVYTVSIQNSVGGTPAVVPQNYYARDATAAITNYTGGHIYLFHDDADATVPIVHSERIGAIMLAAGMSNYTEDYTSAADPVRWSHGYPTPGSDLVEAEPSFKDAIEDNAVWTIEPAGSVVVIGYIVTKRFTIWLRKNGTTSWGVSAAAEVSYDTVGLSYTVTPLTTPIDVSITQGTRSGSVTNISGVTVIYVG